jgi:hypothetical protein
VAIAAGADSAAAESVTLFRVFLNDGSAVVSYGEYARVGDRVIFSMPIGVVNPHATSDPNLHVVNIPAAAVNWNATVKYAEATRFARYIATSAEADYAALTGEVAAVLNAIVLTSDPARRLNMAVEARRRLASWPRDHYGYRADDVREVLGMLDELISTMRAAAGETSFVLDLVADVTPARPITPYSPVGEPTPAESIAQAISVARITDVAADRISLLKAVVTAIDNPGNAVPERFGKPSRRWAILEIEREAKLEEQYASMSISFLKRATAAAARADVRGVEQVIDAARRKDAQLGRRRREEINVLIGQLQAKLDAARQLRLVRDRWKERLGSYRAYLNAIGPVVESLARAQRSLDDIKSLAGSDAEDLFVLSDRLETGSKMLGATIVPDDLKPAHALLASALNLAGSAIKLRRQAVISGQLGAAWDASSAAAGSMGLFRRAQEEMEAVVKLPNIR